MLPILEFVFESFWHFLGTIVLILVIGAALDACLGNLKK